MEIDGSCHCRRIRYRAARSGRGLFLPLHRLLGDLGRLWAVPVAEADFELLSGTPKVYEKRGDSGRISRQHCGTGCASPLYAVSEV